MILRFIAISSKADALSAELLNVGNLGAKKFYLGDESKICVAFLVTEVHTEQIHRLNVEKPADGDERAYRDTVRALLVFLDLLKRNAERCRKPALRNAADLAEVPNAGSNFNVDILDALCHVTVPSSLADFFVPLADQSVRC